MTFGVYPFGIAGGPAGLVAGPPDDFAKIGKALQDLAGDGPPLLVRIYVTFDGCVPRALDQVAQLAQLGSLVDLSLNFHDHDGDVDRWCDFVDQVIRAHGRAVGSIGITNESNLLTVPFAPDGAYPHAREAMVNGILVAAKSKRTAGASTAIGFTVAGEANTTTSAATFWRAVADRGREAFAAALDFAGLTIYPGGFDPHPPSVSDIAGRTAAMLTTYRAQLSAAGIPETVPIRVSECGWPTGPGRTEADQSEALSAIVNTVANLRGKLRVTHLELFTLRDADTSSNDIFGHFGILRDDYTPKPAYNSMRTLIKTIGRSIPE